MAALHQTELRTAPAAEPSPGNDLSPLFTECQSPIPDQQNIALQEAGSGLAAIVDLDVPSNNQLSGRSPLCLQYAKEEFGFHFLVDCKGFRTTTLRQKPLRFIIKSQQIVYYNGATFKLPIYKDIWNVALKLDVLGGVCKKTIQVPFNNTANNFAWGTKDSPTEKAVLWLRVFEVGQEYVADTEGINASFQRLERQLNHVDRAFKYSQNPPIPTPTMATVDELLGTELAVFKGAHDGLYNFWMTPNVWACIVCKMGGFTSQSLVKEHAVEHIRAKQAAGASG